MLKDFIITVLTATPTPPSDPGFWEKIAERGQYSTDVNGDYGLIGKWIEDGFAWLGNKLLNFLDPFINWGGRLIILSCFIIWYCSGERKYIAAAMKWTIILVLFWYIKGAVG